MWREVYTRKIVLHRQQGVGINAVKYPLGLHVIPTGGNTCRCSHLHMPHTLHWYKIQWYSNRLIESKGDLLMPKVFIPYKSDFTTVNVWFFFNIKFGHSPILWRSFAHNSIFPSFEFIFRPGDERTKIEWEQNFHCIQYFCCLFLILGT